MKTQQEEEYGTQSLMRLIVASGKANQAVMKALEAALVGEWEEVETYLSSARELNHSAHEIQTQRIQAEVRGSGEPLSLLAVHAQDHFMNSYLLEEIATYLVKQARVLQKLEARIEKLEQK